MNYLNCNDGFSVINDDGNPIVIRENDRVLLKDRDGDDLFAYTYDGSNGEQKRWQEPFRVTSFHDNALVLSASTFRFMLAMESGLDEPILASVEGAEHSRDRVFYVHNIAKVTISPNFLRKQ